MKRDVDHEGRAESAGPLFDLRSDIVSAMDRTREPDVTIVGAKHTPCAFTVASEVERIFPREVAEMRRDIGIERAANRGARVSPGWEVEACAQVMEYAKTHEHFATEDVRAVYGTPEGINAKAWGSVLKRAARLKIIEADGFVLVNCSNRSPRVRWKSLVFRTST